MLALRVLMLGSALIVLPLPAAAFSPLAVASQPAARRPLAASRHASQGAGTAFVPFLFSLSAPAPGTTGAGGRGPDTRHQVHQYCLHVMPADVLAWPGLCSAGASHWPDLHVGR